MKLILTYNWIQIVARISSFGYFRYFKLFLSPLEKDFLVGLKSTYVSLLYMDDHDCILIIIKHKTTKLRRRSPTTPSIQLSPTHWLPFLSFWGIWNKNYFSPIFFGVSIFYHYHFWRFLLTWNVKVLVP